MIWDFDSFETIWRVFFQFVKFIEVGILALHNARAILLIHLLEREVTEESFDFSLFLRQRPDNLFLFGRRGRPSQQRPHILATAFKEVCF